MDNFFIDITCAERPSFDKAMEIAFCQDTPVRNGEIRSHRASHYIIDDKLGFVLMFYKEGDAIQLPFPIDWKQAADLVWGWLEQVEYPQHDHNDSDVTESKGWKVYTEFWGHVGQYHSAICAVKPAWAWHGK